MGYPKEIELYSPTPPQNKMEKEITRPTVREIEIECGSCKSVDTIFFTNKEIWDNTKIEQPCDKCGRFRIWRIKKGGKRMIAEDECKHKWRLIRRYYEQGDIKAWDFDCLLCKKIITSHFRLDLQEEKS